MKLQGHQFGARRHHLVAVHRHVGMCLLHPKPQFVVFQHGKQCSCWKPLLASQTLYTAIFVTPEDDSVELVFHFVCPLVDGLLGGQGMAVALHNAS